MITVNIWNTTFNRSGLENYGHASMQVANDYVSWWPDRNRQGKNVAGLAVYRAGFIRGRTLLDDIRDERSHPTVVPIPEKTAAREGLDAAAIVSWWQKFSLSSGGIPLQGPLEAGSFYHTVKKNCSTVVATGLRIGGGDRYSSWLDEWTVGLWTPADVRKYAESIRNGLQKKAYR